eukprot:scaffold72311_cov68-Phaeocystis_antarctica.AAC.1
MARHLPPLTLTLTLTLTPTLTLALTLTPALTLTLTLTLTRPATCRPTAGGEGPGALPAGQDVQRPPIEPQLLPFPVLPLTTNPNPNPNQASHLPREALPRLFVPGCGVQKGCGVPTLYLVVGMTATHYCYYSGQVVH